MQNLRSKAAWRIGNGVGRINEVTLRQARLVLGWVTCPGSTPGNCTLFRYVTSHVEKYKKIRVSLNQSVKKLSTTKDCASICHD